jgi:ABC-2 type transport system ATP-binding protein
MRIGYPILQLPDSVKTMAVITLDRVSKQYGRTTAVRELSLSVERGEMFGLIGPDGAGKTTTIRLICGLLPADAGSVRVLDLDPVRDHRRMTGSAGYLSQRFSLYGDLSIDENIAFFAEIHGVRDYRARRDRLLEMTQLAPFRTRLADKLSGGMKQKLALACTLVHEPALIVLDEPTTGVDPVSRREFWKLLSEFLSQGITIVMATPYLDEAERCTRVALLHEGRLLAMDRPDALRATLPGALFEVIVSDHRGAPDVLKQIPGVTDVQMFGERAHVLVNRGDAAAADRLASALAAAGLTAASVRPMAASLEDVFIARLHQLHGASS